MVHERISCGCGGELSRPIPAKCPHCGAQITRVRRSFAPQVLGILVIVTLFVVLIGVLYALLEVARS